MTAGNPRKPQLRDCLRLCNKSLPQMGSSTSKNERKKEGRKYLKYNQLHIQEAHEA